MTKNEKLIAFALGENTARIHWPYFFRNLPRQLLKMKNL